MVMSEDQDYSFKSLKHQTLADLVRNPAKIDAAVDTVDHSGFLPKSTSPVTKKKVELKIGEKASITSNGNGQRGRIFLFKPTKERVTVLREKVGNAYDGAFIHEVVNREGKKFLASTKQLE